MVANTLGPLTLTYVEGFSRSGNAVTVTGWFDTQAQLEQLRELFRNTPGNMAVNTLLGGVQIVQDLTDDSMLTQYCVFDSTKAKSGWYALLGFNYEASELANHWGYSISLLYLGSDAQLIRGFDVLRIASLTNDWGL